MLGREQPRDVRKHRLKADSEGVSIRELIPRRPTASLPIETKSRNDKGKLLALNERFRGPGQISPNGAVELGTDLAQRPRDVGRLSLDPW
jgi:hypothetical protein